VPQNEDVETLERLLAYVAENRRVCPMPGRWNELWQLLPASDHLPEDERPALPLILAAWQSPALLKMLRLQEHIRFAARCGHLRVVDQFLRQLKESDWAHVGDY